MSILKPQSLKCSSKQFLRLLDLSWKNKQIARNRRYLYFLIISLEELQGPFGTEKYKTKTKAKALLEEINRTTDRTKGGKIQ